MSSRRERFAVTAAVLAARLTALVAPFLAASAVVAQQAGHDDRSCEGVLLLRNGSSLQGRITRTAERYEVVVDGGQIHVKAADVELCCRTLEEAYRHKRALIQLGNAYDHLELARWCQRHGLLGSAAQELAHARALDPSHPLIPLVERRIKMSLWRPEPVERPVKNAKLPPPADELDQLVRDMPPGSVETFTQTIQPLLMNNCSTAGCHGPNTESRFRLFRVPSGRSPGRQLTQRNLHSTLQWVDRKEPAASPILTVPIRPHGTAQAAIFTDQEIGQYKRLVDWVYQVAQKAGPAATVAQGEPGQLPCQQKPPSLTMPAVHTAPLSSADEHAAGPGPDACFPPVSTPASRPGPDPAGLRPNQEPNILGSAVKQATPLGQFVPADPFDPEIFNRRFFPQRRKPARDVIVPRYQPSRRSNPSGPGPDPTSLPAAAYHEANERRVLTEPRLPR